MLLFTMHIELQGFQDFKNQHASDEDYATIWEKCQAREPAGLFHIQQDFLFHGNQLCIHQGSTRQFLIQEFHSRGLAAHLGRDKTLAILEERFYWPHIRQDVTRFVQRCLICQTSKGHA